MELFMPFTADGKTCAIDAKFRGFHCTWFRSVYVFCARRAHVIEYLKIKYREYSSANFLASMNGNDGKTITYLVVGWRVYRTRYALMFVMCTRQPPSTHSHYTQSPIVSLLLFFFFQFAWQFRYFHLSSAQQRPRPAKYINRDNRALLCTQ